MDIQSGLEELHRVDGTVRVEQLVSHIENPDSKSARQIVEHGVFSEHAVVEGSGDSLRFHEELRITTISNGDLRVSCLLKRSPRLMELEHGKLKIETPQTIEGMIVTRLDSEENELERFELRPRAGTSSEDLIAISKDLFELLSVLDRELVLRFAQRDVDVSGSPLREWIRDMIVEGSHESAQLPATDAKKLDPSQLCSEDYVALQEHVLAAIKDYATSSRFRLTNLNTRSVRDILPQQAPTPESPAVVDDERQGTVEIIPVHPTEIPSSTQSSITPIAFQPVFEGRIQFNADIDRIGQLDQLRRMILKYGPRVVEKVSIRPNLAEAERLLEALKADDPEKFAEMLLPDIPRVNRIWSASNAQGREWRHVMLEQRLESLKHEAGCPEIDIHTPEGIRSLMPHFRQDLLFNTPNRYGTTLAGMLYSHPKERDHPIVDLLNNDTNFAEVKQRHRFYPWDLPVTRGLHKRNKSPTPLLRKAVYELYRLACQKFGLDVDDPTSVDEVQSRLTLNSDYDGCITNFYNTSLVHVVYNNYGPGSAEQRFGRAFSDAFYKRRSPFFSRLQRS